MGDVIDFPKVLNGDIFFGCSNCGSGEYLISISVTGLIVCSNCYKEHPDRIKWIYKEEKT